MVSYPLTSKIDDVIEYYGKHKGEFQKKLGYDDTKKLSSALYTAWDLLSDFEGVRPKK